MKHQGTPRRALAMKRSKLTKIGLGFRFAVPILAFLFGVSLLLATTMYRSDEAGAVALPVALHGTANLNGLLAPDSAIITVTVGGEPCVTSPAIVHPSGGSYLLAILYAFDGPCSSAGPTQLFINGFLGASVSSIVGPTATVNLNAPMASLTPTASGASPTATPTGSFNTATATPTGTTGQVSTPTSIPTATTVPQTPTPSPTAGARFRRAYVAQLAHD